MPPSRKPTLLDWSQTQLVAEQSLKVLRARRKAERAESPTAVRQEVRDTASDQHANKVVVERPPRLMATRESKEVKTYRLIDYGAAVASG